MVSEIQSKLPPQVAPRADAVSPVTIKPAGGIAPAPQTDAVKADVHLQVPKAEIQYDSEKAHKNLEEAIKKLNDMLKDSGRTLSFSMDVKLGRPIVFVKNMANGEVIRQIPSEVVVRIAHGIEDFKGMLHNASS